MDLEQIERALEKCLAAEDACHECCEGHDSMVVARARWVDSAEVLAISHADDLLRLVRAMRWMADGGVSIEQIEAQMNETTKPQRAT